MSRVIFRAHETLHAPHLIDLEVAQVLRRYVLSAAISAERGGEALSDLAEFPITRHPHFVPLPRIWEMRHDFTAFDAAYLALAEALEARLVTRDRALARPSARVRVEIV